MTKPLPVADIYNLARSAGFSVDQAVIATAVALAESSGNPNNIGDVGLQNATWGPSIGLWQIRSVKAETGKGSSRDASHLKDPVFNAQAAYAISNHGTNWEPWTTFTNGAYKGTLPRVLAALGVTSGQQPPDTAAGGTSYPTTDEQPTAPASSPSTASTPIDTGAFGSWKGLVVKSVFALFGVALVVVGAYRGVQQANPPT